MKKKLAALTATVMLTCGLALGAVVPAQAAVPPEYKDALASAQTYVNLLDISRQGLYDQLVSKYGGQFPKNAANYALKHVKANYSKEALAAAKTYRKLLHLSRAAIRAQLVSKYGGKFTNANADYALKHLG